MIRKGNMCICFKKVPEGTHFRVGYYSWVKERVAREYIKEGYAVEHDPDTKRPERKPAMEVIQPFPRKLGGGWYELENGEKVQGKQAAGIDE